jgi:hypothetical protein
MNVNRKIGLELQNGHDIGRDPRRMTGDELAALGHQRMGPLKALRLRCIDCSGGSANEVRLCTAMQCPAWPFRMGKNPWRAPPSDKLRAHGRTLGRRQRLVTACEALLDKEQIKQQGGAPTTLPATIRVGESQEQLGKKPEDRA